MNVQFLRRYGRLLGFVAAAGVGLCLLAKLPEVVARVVLGETADRQYDARLAAARQLEHLRANERREAALIASRARIVYVTKRRDATDAVAALPVATITETTVTIRDTAYSVAPQVATLVAEQQVVIGMQQTALQAADSALVKTVAAQEKADSLASASSAIATLATAQVEQHRPGFFGRVWGVVRVPLAFAGGVAVGVLAARAVP